MAAIMCQSYMDSQLVESRIHRLMLSSPPQQPIGLPSKSCFWEPNLKSHCDTTLHNQAYASWTTIQSLSTAAKDSTSVGSYVQPEVRQSPVRLSPKSLELCTENLGNETGSDMIESGIELLSSHSSECGVGEASLGIRERQKRKAREGRSFPPPLTTIRGSESIRVRPHREGGRLVLQLTKVPSSFQAERSPGRLRLCFWTEMQYHHHGDDHIQEDNPEDEVEDIEEHEREHEHEYEHEHEHEEEEEEEDERVVAENNGCEWELFHEHGKERRNSWNVEGAVRVENTTFEWPNTRCKEGDHDNINDLLMNWGEPVRLISI
ncbi:unnamed protein product [Sphenostylis stenocarpa]|uniref:FAF domain-containing protein n=1 Tax=Sphenostylis stenocarpa TaxID=92480 RepID=A0AA86RZC1_9FABA|nr:unnamed protein product [Sphenostylis stenocarpa]